MKTINNLFRNLFSDIDAAFTGQQNQAHQTSFYVMQRELEPFRDVARMRAIAYWLAEAFNEIADVGTITLTIIKDGQTYSIRSEVLDAAGRSNADLSQRVNLYLNDSLKASAFTTAELFRVANESERSQPVNHRVIKVTRQDLSLTGYCGDDVNMSEVAHNVAQRAFTRWTANVTDVEFRMVA